MLEYQFRPIALWPGQYTKHRKESAFRASFSNTLDVLETELRFLNAKNVVIQAALDLADIRNDGMIRANACPRSPELILSFDSKVGPLSFPCDTFRDWKSNLRAIALGLEALRAVDRYGVTKQAEQYRGWERIEGPAPLPSGNDRGGMTPQVAASLLSRMGGGAINDILRNPELAAASCRRAVVATHPDAGGDAEDFKRAITAGEVLERHFEHSAKGGM